MASTSEPIIRQPNVCPSCNGQWFDRHFCPSMPWGRTAPGPIFVSIPQVTFPVRAAGEGDTANG